GTLPQGDERDVARRRASAGSALPGPGEPACAAPSLAPGAPRRGRGDRSRGRDGRSAERSRSEAVRGRAAEPDPPDPLEPRVPGLRLTGRTDPPIRGSGGRSRAGP